MSITTHGVSVPMTPDNTIQWTRHEVPSHGGGLYVPESGEGASSSIAETVLRFACLSGQELRANYKVISERGHFSTVYKVGEFAVKVFDTPDYWEKDVSRLARESYIGLSAVRANVILHAGLQRLEGQGTFFDHGGRPIKNSSQDMKAAFVSDVPSGPDGAPTQSQAVWVMSYEAGISASEYQGFLPTPQALADFYSQAVVLCGAHPNDLDYDNERRRDNEIVRVDADGRLEEIVKVDTAAATILEW